MARHLSGCRSIDANDGLAVRHFFESNFVPYRVVGENGSETGMATGYYEPLLKGSRARKGVYKTALYREPSDLLTIDMASAYPQLKGLRLRGKLEGNRVVPYETRGDLKNRTNSAGNEIVWVDDALVLSFWKFKARAVFISRKQTKPFVLLMPIRTDVLIVPSGVISSIRES